MNLLLLLFISHLNNQNKHMRIINTLILIALILIPLTNFATHMQGGEITYKWLGNKKYEVTAKIYRDCYGISLNSPSFLIRASGINPIPIPNTRISIEDITIRCKDSTTKLCNPPNSSNGQYQATELHTFVGYVDFDDTIFNVFPNNGACEVFFSVDQCCRNNYVTTINPGHFYIESMLNICATNYQNTSPQFYNKNVHFAICNKPFHQNYGAIDFIDYDSMSYELITPMTGNNTFVSYNGSFNNKIPATPFCPPNPGMINCKPLPNSNPPRGFYFDPLSGQVIYTPTKCDETSVIAIKTKEFRKNQAGNWQLIGYVIKEVQIIVKSESDMNYYPIFKKNYFNTHTFKTRVEKCIDFETYDTIFTYNGLPFSIPGNLGDVTYLNMPFLPPGSTFRYLDSSAQLKTGRFCWTPHDSIYLKMNNKTSNLKLSIDLNDNFCDFPFQVQRNFSIKLLPPDSLSHLNVQTFIDKNKNSVKNLSEKGFATSLHIQDKHTSKYISTNDTGVYSKKVWKGDFRIGITQHPYIKTTTKDTNIHLKFDSTYHLDFGANLSSGIYGRIYNDTNGNCKYDDGEPTFSGVKVFTDSNKYVGISDINGLYYINAPAGTYNISCGYKDKSLQVNCPSNNQISLTTISDSAYLNHDFGISKNPDFTDIATFLKITRLTRGQNATIQVICKNQGHQKMKNITVTVAMLSNINLYYQFQYKKSFNLKIDSLAPNEVKTIGLLSMIDQNVLKAGDLVCVEAYTDSLTMVNDSIKTNNYEKICGIVNAPYDPNNKLALGDSLKTTLDKTVNYTVKFQNTGTDTAIRVVVTDTIDALHLNLEEFKLNWSDYPCDVIIEGNIIHFIFDNIKLPTLAKSGDKSIGAFNFKLGINPNTKIEKQVSNKVSIFFDYEDPVITLPSIFQIKSPVEIIKILNPMNCVNDYNKVVINSKIKINSGNVYTVQLLDSSNNFISIGQKSSKSINDTISTKVSALKPGKYALRILTSNPPSVSIPMNGIDSLTIYDKPKFNITSNLINNSICLNDSIKITCSNSTLQYKFVTNGNYSSSFSSKNQHIKSAKTNDNFVIIAQDGIGCKDTQSLVPIVNPLPATTLNVLNRKAEYCQSDSVVLLFQGGNSFELTENNVLKHSTTDNNYHLIGLNTATYQLKSRNSFGCVSYSDTINLIFNPLPLSEISIEKNPICYNDSTKLLLSNEFRRDIYLNNGILALDYKAADYKIVNFNDGDKFVMLSQSNKSCNAYSNEIVLSKFPLTPKPIIKAKGNNLSIGQLDGNVKWYRNGVLQQNIDTVFINAQSGNYHVVVTDNNICVAQSNSFKHTRLSLSIIIANSVKIYPNPANEFLTIENLNKEDLNVMIMSVNGQIVINKEIDNQIENLNLTNVPSGIYLLKISLKNGEFIHYKFSIVK
jgi:hypothetical protein